MYIHYWYADYQQRSGSVSKMESLTVTKEQIMENHIQQFALRKNKMFAGSGSRTINQMDKIIEVLTTDKNNTRKEIFEANIVRPGQESFMHGLRVGQYSNQVKNLVAANDLAEEIVNFKTQLNNVIEKIYRSIGGEALSAYKERVLDDYANRSGIDRNTSNFNNSVIDNFLKHEGLVKMGLTASTGHTKQSEVTLETCLRNLVLLAETLPENIGSRQYSTGKDKNLRPTADGVDTLSVIAKKVQGLFSNIVGTGGEIAWKTAEQQGWKETVEELRKMDKRLNFRRMEVRTSGGDRIKNEKNETRVSKGDVHVHITGKNVNIEYGISVKNYRFNPSAASQTVTIMDKTPFRVAAYKMLSSGSEKEYMYNLAAGLEGERNGTKVTAKSLEAEWNSLVERVCWFNFLDFLAGTAEQNSNNVLYLVLNGKILTVDKILLEVKAKDNLIKGRLTDETGVKLQRSYFKGINKRAWVGGGRSKKAIAAATDKGVIDDRQKKGRERSQNVAQELYKALYDAKLTVDLNLLTSLLT